MEGKRRPWKPAQTRGSDNQQLLRHGRTLARPIDPARNAGWPCDAPLTPVPRYPPRSRPSVDPFLAIVWVLGIVGGRLVHVLIRSESCPMEHIGLLRRTAHLRSSRPRTHARRNRVFREILPERAKGFRRASSRCSGVSVREKKGTQLGPANSPIRSRPPGSSRDSKEAKERRGEEREARIGEWERSKAVERDEEGEGERRQETVRCEKPWPEIGGVARPPPRTRRPERRGVAEGKVLSFPCFVFLRGEEPSQIMEAT